MYYSYPTISHSYTHSTDSRTVTGNIIKTPIQSNNKGEKNMSFCIALSGKSGYVLASDSRSTVSNATGVILFDDHFRKIVYLPKSKIGVICAGTNRLDGVEISELLFMWDAQICKAVQGAAQKAETASKWIAQKVLAYSRNSTISFCVANITKQSQPELYYYDIQPDNTMLYNKTESWYNCYGHDIFKALYKTKIGSGGVVENDFIDLSNCTLGIMEEFAIHLIKTAIQVARFRTDTTQSIGGAIQLLSCNARGEPALRVVP